jgi:hypothetical protein
MWRHKTWGAADKRDWKHETRLGPPENTGNTKWNHNLRLSGSQPVAAWLGGRAYVVLWVSPGCHFSHTTPSLPFPTATSSVSPSPRPSWCDSFQDRRNISYDGCGGAHRAGPRQNIYPQRVGATVTITFGRYTVRISTRAVLNLSSD